MQTGIEYINEQMTDTINIESFPDESERMAFCSAKFNELMKFESVMMLNDIKNKAVFNKEIIQK